MSENELSANEGIKQSSGFLRGTIGESLADGQTFFASESDQQLLKFHGLYQQDDRDLRAERKKAGQEKAYSFLIRIRVPGGIVSSSQWLEIDRLAGSYANGTIKLTTRQAFQFHGVIKSNLKQTVAEINKIGMDTFAACGDVNRNVMCGALPSNAAVHLEILGLAREISAHLTPQSKAYHEIWLDGEKIVDGGEEEPVYGKTYLPRKFKIAIAAPPANDVDAFANDLAFLAIIENGIVAGYNVAVGGGMGMSHGNEKTYPVLAREIGFCTAGQVVDIAEKTVLVQRDYGDRTERKHARLKYTIEDRGLDWFSSELERRLGYRLQPARKISFAGNGDRFGWNQDDAGLWHFCFFVQGGRLADSEKTSSRSAMRDIAKKHGGGFRLTPNGNLIIANVSSEKRGEIETVLRVHQISADGGGSALRLHSMSCVALPTCGLALAEAERYLPEFIGELEQTIAEHGLEKEAITVRMTGCPNGCARPFLAEIGIVGKAPNRYNVYLGGGFSGQRLSKLYRESVPSSELKPLLAPLIARYAKERTEGERFGDFCIRNGVVAATERGADFHSNIAQEAKAKR